MAEHSMPQWLDFQFRFGNVVQSVTASGHHLVKCFGFVSASPAVLIHMMMHVCGQRFQFELDARWTNISQSVCAHWRRMNCSDLIINVCPYARRHHFHFVAAYEWAMVETITIDRPLPHRCTNSNAESGGACIRCFSVMVMFIDTPALHVVLPFLFGSHTLSSSLFNETGMKNKLDVMRNLIRTWSPFSHLFVIRSDGGTADAIRISLSLLRCHIPYSHSCSCAIRPMMGHVHNESQNEFVYFSNSINKKNCL